MTILWMYESPLIPEKGGTERATYLVMKGLQKMGYNCMAMLVVHKDGKFSLQDQAIPNLLSFLQEKKIDVVINQMGYQQWLLESFLKHGGKEWKQLGGKIITCLHFSPEEPSLLSVLLSKTQKNLNDYLQITKQLLFYPYYKYKAIKYSANLFNNLYSNSDRFILLSETHYPILKGLMKRNDYDKLDAINNPLTFPDISSREILNTKKKQVLVVSRMQEYYKRTSLAIKAWEFIQKTGNYKDWELIIVGSGESLQQYLNYVNAHKVNNIRFVGQQSPEPYYRNASIFLMTSSKEGWGLTLTESLQRGVIPIVMNSCPVFLEIIEDGKNGFITPNNNLPAFVEKITLLMDNSSMRISMGEYALKSAYRYTTEFTIDKWDKVLSTIISN